MCFVLCKKAVWGPAVFIQPQLLTLLVSAYGIHTVPQSTLKAAVGGGERGQGSMTACTHQCCCVASAVPFWSTMLLHLLPGPGTPAQQVAFFPVNLCQTLVPVSRFAVLCSGHWGGKAVQALTHSKNPRGNGRFRRWISWAEVKGTQWDLLGFLLFHEIKGVIRKTQDEQKNPHNLK